MKITDELLYQHAPAARDLWLASLPEPEDIRSSRRFRRKMAALLRQARRTPAQRVALRQMKRAAMIALVAAVTVFSCAMTVEAFREKVLQVITTIFQDRTEFRYSPAEDVPAEGQGLGELTFGYLPEGMELVDSQEDAVYRHLKYTDAAENYLMIDQSDIDKSDSSTVILDTEDSTAEHLLIGDEEAALYQKDGRTILHWTIDHSVLILSTNLSRDEAISVAEALSIMYP